MMMSADHTGENRRVLCRRKARRRLLKDKILSIMVAQGLMVESGA